MKDHDFDCDKHHEMFAPKMHPEHTSKGNTMMADHERGTAHPQHHTKGKMRAQMNPDHGPHK